ncbi:murein transglycosylase [Kordiimonas sediminis]|uniref:Murein transglycosylase n=1 Tax=Kordiimonas sediminis TaxID=1735581 RepID=A0A919AW70_9PROT|nr:lytic murein transglycosylase [Kordiimonas sediminis]GHF28076.1 murein transglycosylase [Kordiimonas sediminis]
MAVNSFGIFSISAGLLSVISFGASTADNPQTSSSQKPVSPIDGPPAESTSENTASTNTSASPELTEEEIAFKSWIDGVYAEGIAKGISEETLNKVLPTIALRPTVIKRDRNQPEVKQTYAMYLKSRVSPWRKTKGKEMMATHKEDLSAVSASLGVQERFISAVWGVETNYGTIPLSISVFDALATLAYDPRRASRFRKELFAALEITDQGLASFENMKGSWAGAMGQPQFMPLSYLQYAVDFDKDGDRDIWSTGTDVFASIGNYLKAYGWRNDQTWGRPVLLPKGSEKSLYAPQSEGVDPDRYCKSYKSLGAWRDLQDWQKLGVRRLDGTDLPDRSIPAALIVADEGDDRGYLVYRNFCSIMRYNPSFKYALSVGLLSDEIGKP